MRNDRRQLTALLTTALCGLAPSVSSAQSAACQTPLKLIAPFTPGAGIDLPTLAEAKAGNVNVDMWYGFFAPKGTPADIVNLYNREINQLLSGEDVQKAFVSQGMDPSGSTPQAFAQLVERDAERCARLIKDQGIKAD
jgi:tripartite-type tricarboxylate transporter receptor subunit TctC